jgi:hypothetical protein
MGFLIPTPDKPEKNGQKIMLVKRERAIDLPLIG